MVAMGSIASYPRRYSVRTFRRDSQIIIARRLRSAFVEFLGHIATKSLGPWLTFWIVLLGIDWLNNFKLAVVSARIVGVWQAV
jgi:hypothetical protein